MPSGVYERSPEFLANIAKRLTHGHKHTEESKKKLSLKHTGKKLSEETKKKISLIQTGKKHKPRTIEHRKKMSEMFRGDKGPNWQGGKVAENKKIRHSIEYRLWREAVFARDNWTCQECGVRGGNLRAHHIKWFAKYVELRFAIDNGLTMCKGCHDKFHKNEKTNTK